MIRSHVLICGGTGCTSSGSVQLQAAFNQSIADFGLAEEVKLVQTGCFGLCALGPIVIIYLIAPHWNFVALSLRINMLKMIAKKGDILLSMDASERARWSIA